MKFPIKQTLTTPLELWGGVECTHNRVGDVFFDQLERSGHASRISDLDLFAELGLRAIRYPILWERVAPNGIERADWTWAQERLCRLRGHGIEPIVGLLHHGSGPPHTSLMSPEFPEQLAEYAGAVARRFPWVRMYSPVNEPMTTARFSGLYGHWYPHGRDGKTWARILLNQCRGVALSMKAIREVNPDAQLLQTEDIGKTYSTPRLAYQAEFENERRWLTLDLLGGRVDAGHPMAEYFRSLGVADEEWKWFEDNPCRPDIFGCDNYVNSERFLDEHLERYPVKLWGGNDIDRYADVEAVHVRAEGIAGPAGILREVWDRYGGPVAITEAHLNADPHDQMRWLQDNWDAAASLREEGIDVRAVTTWSLLGAYDWNGLVTCQAGFYEAGAFTLCDGHPRPTPLAEMLKDLAFTGRHDSHALGSPGWWRQPERLIYPPVSAAPRRPSLRFRARRPIGGRPRLAQSLQQVT